MKGDGSSVEQPDAVPQVSIHLLHWVSTLGQTATHTLTQLLIPDCASAVLEMVRMIRSTEMNKDEVCIVILILLERRSCVMLAPSLRTTVERRVRNDSTKKLFELREDILIYK